MKPRPGPVLTSVMVLLTLTTGMIEAVSFLTLGPVFAAVQTGSLLLLGFAIAGAPGISAVVSGVSLAGFAFGAIVGSHFQSAIDARERRWFDTALVVEGVLLWVAAVVIWRAGIEGPGGPVDGRHLAAIAMVACAMGVRNVTSLRVQVPDVPTTVATRALTGLLIALPPLAADSRVGGGLSREARRIASIAAMFAGALLAAWLLERAVPPAAVLAVPATLILALGLALLAFPRERTSVPG
ncbi:YoaK family protein [Streptomyces sp. NPDC005805]|uniref:YoaK family protein n=1 Tax=Streptomyces sp. NPDC005805 TaxID=3157068 RepID=UPI00340ECBE0